MNELERIERAAQSADPNSQPEYLGDAVYASFDGWQIELRTRDGNNQVIYLDPGVYRALRCYAKRIWGEKA